jgi:hypothetical protein
MEPGIATQLITVSATLAGVVLTLLANAFLERRRARDTRQALDRTQPSLPLSLDPPPNSG